MAQEKVMREDIKEFAHQIDEAQVHPAVLEADRNKLVATNASTGAIEFIPKSDVSPDLTHNCYIAWRDTPGVGFTLTPNITLPYEAILITHQVLDPPVEADFEGYWRERIISTEALPPGGTINQVLMKQSNSDFDVIWANENNIAIPDHNDLQGLNEDDYVHHTATEITQHPYLNAENVFTGLINEFNDIVLNGGTPDKWLKLDADNNVVYADLPALINTFLGLTDVIPDTYLTYDQNVPIVNEAQAKLDFIATEEILTKFAEFTDLSDVPNDYTGHEGDLVVVNGTADGLTFITNPDPNKGDGYIYFGDSTTDGSWRIGKSGNNFVTEIRVTGSWVPKETYTP